MKVNEQNTSLDNFKLNREDTHWFTWYYVYKHLIQTYFTFLKLPIVTPLISWYYVNITHILSWPGQEYTLYIEVKYIHFI